MKKIKKFLKRNNKKIGLLALSIFAFLPSVAHAEGGAGAVGIEGISTTVNAIMSQLGNEVWKILQAVAPIALGIGGALLAFKLGKKMFKTLTSA